MKQSLDATEFMSSVTMMARKAETYPPETPVIDLEELQRIIWQRLSPRRKQAEGENQEGSHGRIHVTQSWPPLTWETRNQTRRRPMSGSIRRIC
jgi:hypothetical protein